MTYNQAQIVMVSTFAIATKTPFKDLFAMRSTTLADIIEDMNKNGFDMAHPLILWRDGSLTLVDGHTRLKAAIACGIDKVPVICKDFEDEGDALEYAIRSQANRRNLTDYELLQCLQKLDCRKKLGRPIKSSSISAGRSSDITAEILGISRAKVEKLRTINEYGDDEIKEALAQGKYSINGAYQAVMQPRRKKVTFEPDADASLIYSVMSDIHSRLTQTQIRKLVKALQNTID